MDAIDDRAGPRTAPVPVRDGPLWPVCDELRQLSVDLALPAPIETFTSTTSGTPASAPSSGAPTTSNTPAVAPDVHYDSVGQLSLRAICKQPIDRIICLACHDRVDA
jgi:hypothetical protein